MEGQKYVKISAETYVFLTEKLIQNDAMRVIDAMCSKVLEGRDPWNRDWTQNMKQAYCMLQNDQEMEEG